MKPIPDDTRALAHPLLKSQTVLAGEVSGVAVKLPQDVVVLRSGSGQWLRKSGMRDVPVEDEPRSEAASALEELLTGLVPQTEEFIAPGESFALASSATPSTPAADVDRTVPPASAPVGIYLAVWGAAGLALAGGGGGSSTVTPPPTKPDAGLTLAQIAALTGPQVAALSMEIFSSFNLAQLDALSADGVSGITPAQLATLAGSEIAGLGTDIASLSVTTVASLSAAQASGLTLAQIAALTASQVAALSVDTFSAFNLAQLDALSANGVSGITTAELATLSSSEIAGLGTDIVSLSLTTLASLSATQATGLTLAQIAALTGPQVAALPVVTFAAFDTTQLDALSANGVSGITVDELATLSNSEISALGTDIASLSLTTLASLTATQVAGLTLSQVTVITAAQIAALAPSSFAALDLAHLDALSASAVSGITSAQFATLDSGEIAALGTDIHALSSAHFAAMSGLQADGLSLAQLNTLDATNLGAISTAAVGSLNNTQAQALLNTADLFALFQGGWDANGNYDSARGSKLNQLSGKIAFMSDATRADGLANGSNPLTQYVDAVTGSDIVSSAEHTAGFSVTGRATAGATVTLALDNNRTDGVEELGTVLTTVRADSEGRWSYSFAPGSAALVAATPGVLSSGIHKITAWVDADSSATINGGETAASRIFLVSNGTAQPGDDGSMSKNYSQMDLATNAAFIYFWGDPDGNGVGVYTDQDPGDNAAGTAVLSNRDGNLVLFAPDADYYSNTVASNGGAGSPGIVDLSAATVGNAALGLVTDIPAQIWEFHALSNQGLSSSNYDQAVQLAGDHTARGSNTSHLVSLAEAMALYAANIGITSGIAGALQPMTDEQSFDPQASQYGYPLYNVDYDNRLGTGAPAAFWSGDNWTAAASPSGHIRSHFLLQFLGDVSDSVNQGVFTTLASLQGPTLTISDDTSGVATATVHHTFTFSEDVTGFTVEDIQLSDNARAGTFTAVDAKTYTLDITPVYGSGSYTVDVRAESVAGADGAMNTGAFHAAQDYNRSWPQTLSLGTIAGYNVTLVNPTTTADGKTYYYWDKNQNGVSIADSGDGFNHNQLDAIFNNGNDTVDTQTGGAVRGVDDARTFVLGGQTVVLPTLSELLSLYNDPLPNPPAGWEAYAYWTATKDVSSSPSNHYLVGLEAGYSFPVPDTNGYYAAVQVL